MSVESNESKTDKRLAYVLLRTMLGLDFLGHGFIRLLHGDAAFAHSMVGQLAGSPLPSGFVHSFGLVLPFLEFSIGFLLVMCLFTRCALVAGSLVMMSLMVGTTLHQDWAAAGLQLSYSLVFSVLLFLRAEYDTSWPRLLRG